MKKFTNKINESNQKDYPINIKESIESVTEYCKQFGEEDSFIEHIGNEYLENDKHENFSDDIYDLATYDSVMSLLEKYGIDGNEISHVYLDILAMEKYIKTIPDTDKILKKLNKS